MSATTDTSEGNSDAHTATARADCVEPVATRRKYMEYLPWWASHVRREESGT